MSPIDSITVGAQVGVILPLLTAVVQRPAWSAKAKRVVAAVAALVAGVLTVAVDGGWAQFQLGTHTTLTVLGVLAAAQTSYDLVWKPTRVAPTIETVTSPKAAMKAG
ncbi:hypothetical protein ACFWRZ_08540 [Streptomyces rubiginosohelvolus]|uniref:hypothetical protein n=1 Tax=Streptomyces rubiginosohelvolus TaxID=67362 RepID=UPI003657DC8F